MGCGTSLLEAQAEKPVVAAAKPVGLARNADTATGSRQSLEEHVSRPTAATAPAGETAEGLADAISLDTAGAQQEAVSVSA